jgi:outer membrane protein TolC
MLVTAALLSAECCAAAEASATPAPAAAATSTAETQVIDLPTALRLAGLNNLDLALVREAEQQAVAANDSATLAFFPWLDAGVGYARRTGAFQQASGVLLEADAELDQRALSLNAGIDVGAALFNKFAARQLESAARYQVEAARNDTALAAAGAYFDLVNAMAATDIAQEAVRISSEYEQQLQRAFAIGLSNRSDVLRVGVQTQRYQILLRQAQAAAQSHSATLATVLHLDPTLLLQPLDRLVVPPTLVPLDGGVAALVSEGLAARPELKSSAAAVAAAQDAQRSARYGPLIPSLGASAAAGQVRGGANGDLTDYLGAHDVIIGVQWRIGPGGLLDFGRTESADSQLRQQRLGNEKLRQGIAQQVMDAYTAARAGADQIQLARRSVELAAESLKLSEERKEFGVYAVLEVIQAQQDLTQARNDYSQALTQYAKAQYALAHAAARISE